MPQGSVLGLLLFFTETLSSRVLEYLQLITCTLFAVRARHWLSYREFTTPQYGLVILHFSHLGKHFYHPKKIIRIMVFAK